METRRCWIRRWIHTASGCFLRPFYTSDRSCSAAGDSQIRNERIANPAEGGHLVNSLAVFVSENKGVFFWPDALSSASEGDERLFGYDAG